MKGVGRTTQRGFSAVELLITLFIAAAFIATGYQLYLVVIRANGDARMRAVASNIAYNNLRAYAAQTTNPCTTITPTPTPSIPNNSGLPSNATITVTVSCPFSGSPASRVTVLIKYGTPQKEVTHAIFVSN